MEKGDNAFVVYVDHEDGEGAHDKSAEVPVNRPLWWADWWGGCSIWPQSREDVGVL